MRRALPVIVLLAAALALLALACDGGGLPKAGDGDPNTPAPVPKPSPFPGITSEVVVPNAAQPVALAFAPDGRLFYAERDTGSVRVVTADGQLLEKPLLQTPVAVAPGWGMLGLALDPLFESNHFIYVYMTRVVDERTAQPVLTRYTEADNKAASPTPIIDDLPEAQLYGEYAVGGDIRFGPDGYLYVTIGDHISTDFAQDLGSPRGKILRVDRNGSPAPGNPFAGRADADPRVFAYGFLDSHDMTFEAQGGDLYATENGTYFCCDEINIVRAGQDYGWPKIGQDQVGALPIYYYAFPGTESGSTKVHPEGIEFASGDKYPALGDSLLTCEQDTGYMRRLVLNASRKVQSDDVVVSDCTYDISAGPDGTVYYSNATEIRKLVEG